MATRGEAGPGGEGSVERGELSLLQEECALLRSVAEVAADAVVVLNLDGGVRRAFRTYARVIGYDPDEVEGRSLFDFVHPDDVSVATDALSELASPGAVVSRIIRIRHRDGHYLEVESTAHNRADDPHVRGIIVHSRDVSQRRALERRLQLAERMEAVGRLASGVAHDFNNILAVIQLSVARAQARRGDIDHLLAQVQRAAERASSLTKRMLAFARERPHAPSPENLARLVRSMADTLSSLLPESVVLDVIVGSEGVYVLADPSELEQVVLNLVLNARDAVTHGGRIAVSVDCREIEGEEQALLTVRDDGSGMDETTRAQALEPFFTTKPAGVGTGLGLWTVRDFVSRANGAITIDSEPGLGTTFQVALPLARRRGSRKTLPPLSPPKAPASLTILLAEDEPVLRETVAELLRDQGHRVLAARDGEEALSIATRTSDPIDVLVTDVIMPRMGGIELCTRLRQTRPDLCVLFVTGYGEAGEGKAPGNSRLLRKPFLAQQLAEELGRLIAQAG